MIYLDNAATSYPKPRAVKQALLAATDKFGGNPGRGGHALSLAAAEMVYDCRVALASLFSYGQPENIVFTAGATAALNLAILTRVRRGMHILISDREHNAVLRPVAHLAREGIAEYDIYPTAVDPVSAIRERLRPNTGIVVACHVSNVTGFSLPLCEIAALCHERGIHFIIDAAQSAGHIPINLGALPFDAFCAPAHKGLLGVAGAGIAILADSEGRAPFLSGGSGVDSLSLQMPQTLPERYEAGTLPTPAIAALAAGIRHLTDRGIAAIQANEERMHRRIVEGLSVCHGIRIFEPECRGGLIAFTHDLFSPEALATELNTRGIAVRAGYHCAPLAHRTIGTPPGGCVRVSLGAMNQPKDAECFLRAVTDILSP